MAHERPFFPSSSALSRHHQQQQQQQHLDRLEENSSSFASIYGTNLQNAHNNNSSSSNSSSSSSNNITLNSYNPNFGGHIHGGAGPGGGHEFLHVIDELRSSAKLKADMVSHPLFEQLLRAHVQCLSVGLPPDHVRALEDQLANTHSVAIKYLMLSKDDDDDHHHHHHHHAHHAHHDTTNTTNTNANANATSSMGSMPMPMPMQMSTSSSPMAGIPPNNINTNNNNNNNSNKLLSSSHLLIRSSPKENIDEFMENYLQLLMILRRHLEEYVIPQSSNAMDALCELEQAFCDLTGASPDDISNARNANHELNEEYTSTDHDLGEVDCGVDPLYDIDRSLFEYVRMELKHKLKDRYRESIVAIRDEIIRKRLAGKLPGDVTVLKKWWNAHSKWPYPTEDEKKRMMDETGLEMRQINNWFINHRKRNWNSRAPNSSSGSTSHQ